MKKQNAADRLISRIMQTQNPSVVGLDPVIGQIPTAYYAEDVPDPLLSVADTMERWGRDVIDAVSDIVPAVKPPLKRKLASASTACSVWKRRVIVPSLRIAPTSVESTDS